MTGRGPGRVRVGRRRSAGRCSSSRASSGVGWDEVVEVRLDSGEVRHGVVLDVDRDARGRRGARGHCGLRLDGRAGRLHRRPDADPRRRAAGSGRVCNGRGEPLDGGPPVAGRRVARRSAAARSTRPRARRRATRSSPASRRSTGSRRSCAARSCRSSRSAAFRISSWRRRSPRRRPYGDEPFAVVFAAMGVTNADADRGPGRARGARGVAATWRCSSTPPTTRSSSGS